VTTSRVPRTKIEKVRILTLGTALGIAVILFLLPNTGRIFPNTVTFDSTPDLPNDIVGPSVYGGDTTGIRYYRNSQITAANVRDLRVAWSYSTGDAAHESMKGQVASSIGFECSPILCHKRLIVVTPTEALLALNPVTGRPLWRFEPTHYDDIAQANRGASCWIGPANDPHPHRILYTFWSQLWEVDADTGQAISTFGKHGSIDLTAGIDRGHPEMIRANTPPLVVGDLVICPFQITDDLRVDSPRGDLRAYDIHTGALRWTWHTIPIDPNDPASRTWQDGSGSRTGGANVWSMISYDRARGLIYCPVGCPSNDHYGGTRPGNNLYANSLVCLNAETGVVKWSYQVVHHDLWDYDIPCEPILFDCRREGANIPAVAIVTKMGRMFLFNRVTGAPLYPIDETPVPKSDLPGEWTSPTQPLPTLPPPLVPQSISISDAWGATKETKREAQKLISDMKARSIFAPPSLRSGIVNPGLYGGCNWAGMAFDEKENLIITTTNRFPFTIRLHQRDHEQEQGPYPMYGTPYWADFSGFMTPDWLPRVTPPWGTMVAVNPSTGAIVWQRPVGYLPEASNVPGYKEFGSTSVGGCITTDTGLVFETGTRDCHLYAIDANTGKELASFPLPYVGASLPIIYSADGKEYLISCCGGHGFTHGALGDQVLAFALPAAQIKP